VSNRAKTEVGITGLGIMLGTLGVLLPSCSPLAVLGVIISAIGFGMIIAGAIGGGGRPPGGLASGPSDASR
jgi:hypothetical protein